MLPSEKQLGQGFAGLIKHFGWQRIVIVSQEDGQFPLVSRLMVYIWISLMIFQVAASIIGTLEISNVTNVYISSNTDLSKLNFIVRHNPTIHLR